MKEEKKTDSGCLKEYGMNSIEEAMEVTKTASLDVYKWLKVFQPICFENANGLHRRRLSQSKRSVARKQEMRRVTIGEVFSLSISQVLFADQRKVVLWTW